MSRYLRNDPGSLQGLLAVYFVTLAGMLIFVFVVKLLGEAGGSCRRLFKRSPVPVVGLVQAFQSRRVAIMAGGTGWLALLVMVHVEHFSFPPSFRRPTLLGKGNPSRCFRVLSSILSITQDERPNCTSSLCQFFSWCPLGTYFAINVIILVVEALLVPWTR